MNFNIKWQWNRQTAIVAENQDIVQTVVFINIQDITSASKLENWVENAECLSRKTKIKRKLTSKINRTLSLKRNRRKFTRFKKILNQNQTKIPDVGHPITRYWNYMSKLKMSTTLRNWIQVERYQLLETKSTKRCFRIKNHLYTRCNYSNEEITVDVI